MTIRRWLAEKLGVKFTSAAEREVKVPAAPKLLSNPFIYFTMKDFAKPITSVISKKNDYGVSDIQEGWTKIANLIKSTPGAKEQKIPVDKIASDIKSMTERLPHIIVQGDICMDKHTWGDLRAKMPEINRCIEQYRKADSKKAVVPNLALHRAALEIRKLEPNFNCGEAADRLSDFIYAFKIADKLHRPTQAPAIAGPAQGAAPDNISQTLG